MSKILGLVSKMLQTEERIGTNRTSNLTSTRKISMIRSAAREMSRTEEFLLSVPQGTAD